MDTVEPNKELICIRGVKGTGKTSLAQIITSHNTGAENLRTIETWMKQGLTPIVAEGVLSKMHDFQEFFRLANQHGYTMHIVTVEGWHQSPDFHSEVPSQQIKTANEWQVIDPHLRPALEHRQGNSNL